MATTEVVVKGAVTADGQLILDEPPALAPGRVEVTVPGGADTWVRPYTTAAERVGADPRVCPGVARGLGLALRGPTVDLPAGRANTRSGRSRAVADKGHRMGNVDWTATGTWLLAAITLVYVVVVWRQAVIARDAAKHAEAAAVAAKQSAEAAEAMVQIASGQLAEMRRMTEATLRAAEAASEQARLDRERLAHQRPRIVLLRRRGDPSQVLLMNQGRLSASDAQVALRRAHGAGIGR